MPSLKQHIAANFSASASSYDQYARMQQHAARLLLARLVQLRPQVPAGPILEFGCGTGAISRHLPALFPGHPLTLMDIAPGMIAINRQTLSPHLPTGQAVDWQVRDAEALSARSHYALIVSSLTMQWFQDLEASLARLGEALLPGGLLLCSYLGQGSFPEWRELCQRLALPCTMNPLPDGEQVGAALHRLGLPATIHTESMTLPYPSAQAFFQSLKHTGTRTAATRNRLRGPDLRRLLRLWPQHPDGTITVSYIIHTLEVRP